MQFFASSGNENKSGSLSDSDKMQQRRSYIDPFLSTSHALENREGVINDHNDFRGGTTHRRHRHDKHPAHAMSCSAVLYGTQSKGRYHSVHLETPRCRYGGGSSSSSGRSSSTSGASNNCHSALDSDNVNDDAQKNKAGSSKDKSGVFPLPVSRIFPVDEFSSSDVERVSSMEEKGEGQCGFIDKENLLPNINKGISFDKSRCMHKLVSTHMHNSPSIDGSEAAHFIGHSLSNRSELTCVEIMPFEMPSFPILDSPDSLTSNEGMNVHEEGEGGKEERREQRQREQLDPKSKEEPAPQWSQDPASLNLRIMRPFFSSYRDITINNSNEESDGQPRRSKCQTAMLFICLGLLFPFILQEVFVLVNHYSISGLILCGGISCVCTCLQSLAFVFVYGIHLYIPYALLSPTLFFMTYNAIKKKTRERELHAQLSRYVINDSNSPPSRSQCSYDGDNQINLYSHVSRNTEVRIPRSNQTSTSSLQWDLPPCIHVLRQGVVFWIIVITRFVLLAFVDTQLPRLTQIPRIVYGPMHVIALFLPLFIYSIYENQPFLAIPFILLDGFAFFFQLILESNTLQINKRCMLGPLLLVVLERCFLYISAITTPKETPVGVKITYSSLLSALYFIMIFSLSLPVRIKEDYYIAIVMTIQIFLWELLFNTLIVEVFAYRIYIFFPSRIFHQNNNSAGIFPMKCTDVVNISTQVRWPNISIGVISILPFFQFHQWHRPLPHADCRGALQEGHVFAPTFLILLFAILLATFITIIIRWKNHLLRAPLLVEDWFLLPMCGWYLFSSVPLALAAML